MPRATRITTIVIGLTAAAALAGGTTVASAAADEDAPFVTSIQVSDYHLDSGGCHDIPLSERFDAAGERVTGITVQVHHGATALPSVVLAPTSAKSRSASGQITFCPTSDRALGQLTVGPSTVHYQRPDGSSATQESLRQAEFTVDQRTTSTIATAHHGRTLVLRATVRAYDVSRHRHQKVDHLRVALQRRAHPSAAWKTVAHASTGSHGVAVFHEPAKHHGYYRATVAGTGHTTPTASRSVHR